MQDAALGGQEGSVEAGVGPQVLAGRAGAGVAREEVGGDDAPEVLCGVRARDGDQLAGGDLGEAGRDGAGRSGRRSAEREKGRRWCAGSRVRHRSR